MGMKANSGFFKGTLGSTYGNGSLLPEKYSDRNIEVPENVESWMQKLQNKGDLIKSTSDDFSMKDVSALSKETGVEYAKIVVGDKAYLIKGDNSGTDIPNKVMNELKSKGGNLEFHSHPYDNDIIPSISDLKLMNELKSKIGQMSSKIVTPNGKTSTFNEYGVIETGYVSNALDDNLKAMYEKLFGGN